MARRRPSRPVHPLRTAAPASPPQHGHSSLAHVLPLGALAAGFGLMGLVQAQEVAPPVAAAASAPAAAQAQGATPAESALRKITVKGKGTVEQGRDNLKAETSRIGKGNQELRDIPQSVTVLTERLMDDRNLDDFKDVLRNTAGISFLAGETGEEDIRLRGFSLVQAGDIYVDGMRDSSLYERDTFNNDRVEILKGSASMLFGRGSTGGVVNQANKQVLPFTQHEVTGQVGTGNEWRFTGDFNFKTGETEGLRVNAMVHKADNWGAKVDKTGIAPTYTWGMGTPDEVTASLYHLEYENRPNYNHPWFVVDGKLVPTLAAKNYYGLASDYLKGSATYGTFTHTHRFSPTSELRTTVRHGRYKRDLWTSVIRFGTTNGATTTLANLSDDTLITRTPKGRVAVSDTTLVQSDYSDRFQALGLRHQLITGIDLSHEGAKRNNNFAGTASGLTSTVGTPNDGDSVADTRGTPTFNTFTAKNLGLYAQDTVALTEALKLVAGLRFDRFQADYVNAATATAASTSNSRSDSLWSPRLGALFQPNEWASYYASYGTSYNTAGDTYQFSPGTVSARVANTAPEKSRNFEVGAKFDLFEGRMSLSTALFRSEKYNERNTDPDTAATQELLSGKRHASGMDLNVAGRITPDWEMFVSYTWIPDAKIDESNVALAASGSGAQVKGDRPGLTPRHSASLWTTYRLLPKLRIGGGLNYRGEQNPEGARQVTAQAFTTLDAMAEYSFSEAVSVKFNVANLTDELYADSLYRGFYTPGAPRTAQLQLKAKF
ncbi:catecholate siderophore receptor [Sphaerotilus hippei]|uniref:Catecholate siderophore receptor n=1 Tax=Sphaerotilus hippei TaxID=744406 RepID=A0A318H356_9BURK|nr:TonB-dependent siderophore receptor [Sphaerotilus hippei]PXW96132.1 catecholate siderophore receptor [Sphaerotilus hippei]